MPELLIYAAALLVLFNSARVGARTVTSNALAWMLASLVSFFVTLRLWFLLSRAAAAYTTAPPAFLAALCFWILFILVFFVFLKLRDTHIDQFESVMKSFVGSVFGAIFGTVTGAVFGLALILTASIVVPQYFSANTPTPLPITIESVPAFAFRYIETTIAGVKETDPAHTPLPVVRNPEQNPTICWR